MKNLIPLFVILPTLQAYRICTESKCSLLYDQYICPNANLTFIPIAAINTIVLDLSGNHLTQIEPDDFAEFKHLTVLRLSNVNLKLIHRNAFRKTKFLEKVDLSMNLLKFLYPDTFSDTIIQHLNLSGNIFGRLVGNQFIAPHLQYVDLSNGFLENVHKEAFASSNNSLRWVNLSANKLTTLPISEILLSCSRLEYLILNNNAWSCDCDFYLMSKTPIVYHHSVGLRCELDREYTYANDTSFLESTCVDYLNKTYAQIAAKNLEKNSRDENATNLILNVYGYVMIGFSILVIFCCCCKRKTGTDEVDEQIKPTPVIDKCCKSEKNFEQVHTFEKCKVEFHQDDNEDVNKITVSDR